VQAGNNVAALGLDRVHGVSLSSDQEHHLPAVWLAAAIPAIGQSRHFA
jgi:hypothetical protein